LKIGYICLELDILEAFSLKDKRRVLKSIKERIKNKFNVSISEVDYKDIWNRSLIAIATVSDDSSYIDKQLSEVINFIENIHSVAIMDIKQEML
jgi:uncharacterized protein YlxP (DUF503 family)